MERNFGTGSARVAPQPAGDGGVLDPYAMREQPALQFRGGAPLPALGEQFAFKPIKARPAVTGTAAGSGLGLQKGGFGGRVEGSIGGGFRVHWGMMNNRLAATQSPENWTVQPRFAKVRKVL